MVLFVSNASFQIGKCGTAQQITSHFTRLYCLYDRQCWQLYHSDRNFHLCVFASGHAVFRWKIEIWRKGIKSLDDISRCGIYHTEIQLWWLFEFNSNCGSNIDRWTLEWSILRLLERPWLLLSLHILHNHYFYGQYNNDESLFGNALG